MGRRVLCQDTVLQAAVGELDMLFNRTLAKDDNQGLQLSHFVKLLTANRENPNPGGNSSFVWNKNNPDM